MSLLEEGMVKRRMGIRRRIIIITIIGHLVGRNCVFLKLLPEYVFGACPWLAH